MRILGEWLVCTDGVTRPVVLIIVSGGSGLVGRERFLLDTGADTTVLTAGLVSQLQLPTAPPPPGVTVSGIGGGSGIVEVAVSLEFLRDAGATVRVHGRLAAFVDPSAVERSVLGRDILDHFDVIVSRRRNEVLLLHPNHQYHVTGP